MKKLFLLILFVGCNLFAGELKIDYLATDSTLKLSYNDNTVLFENNAKLFAVAYLFRNQNNYPEAISIPLENLTKGKFEVNYRLNSENILFALFKVGDNQNWDTKNFEFFEYVFLNSTNSPKLNTFYKIGLSYYGTIAPNIKRIVDLKKAGEYFEKELEIYPDNIYAKIAKNALKYENKNERDEAYYNFLSSLIKNFDVNNADDFSALNAIRIMKAIGKEEQATKTEKKYAELNPKSVIAEQLQFDKIKGIKKQKRFNNLVIEYLKDFPKSQNYEKAFFALMDSYKLTDQLPTFVEICKNLPGLSTTLVSKAINRMDDKYQGFDFIKYVYENFDSFKENKEVYLTNDEYSEQIKIQKLLLAETIIENYYAYIDEKLRTDIFSNDFLPIANVATEKFLDNYLEFYKNKKEYRPNLSMIEEMINIYSNSDKLIELHKENYRLLNYDIQTYDKYYDKLIAQKKAKSFNDLKFENYNIDLTDNVIQNTNNDLVNLKFYKGKIIVLEFWATWVSSSESIIKTVDSVINSTGLYDEVVFIPVSVWEKDKDIKKLLSDFASENNLKQTLYYDNDNSLPYSAGITGIPARIFIDKSGKIRFIENGFTDIESYIENLKLKTEFLK